MTLRVKLPARTLPVHYIVGISVLFVLHRVITPIHILHLRIHRRERELSTPCTTDFQIIPISRLVVHIPLPKSKPT